MNEPIAIIGIGCRFPGGANSPQAFWEMLCAGTDAIREIPAERWNIAAHYDPVPGREGKSISRWGGFVDNIDGFDPGFFGISDREADAIDPQQRLLLETSWEAFEDSGETLETLRGSSTGVFVGISTSDFAGLQHEGGGRSVADVYSATGSAFSIAANRISYCFDLRGPSLAVDTACSSALTACHIACESLWRGDCTMAVVGGVSALLGPETFFAFSRMSMLSPDGRCKAFDASANGFVRAEGAGAVLLKPFSAAQAAGDRIYAVIRSTAANQDGRTNGITVPSRQAQEDLIRQACLSAGFAPSQIAYVEAHGTGTPIGDPIEAAAISAALCGNRKNPCLIGSVKTNIGHLESASGAASIIKVALILKHKTIPPSLHFKKPNPRIDFRKLNLRVVNRLQPFPRDSRPALAGINSFGFGGANAHVILQATPARPKKPLNAARGRQPFILPISAHTREALLAAVANYRALLQQPATDAWSLCAAAATRRSHLPYRLCFVAASRKQLLQRLDESLAGEITPALVTGHAAPVAGPVFVFSGQGPQWWAMGRQLLAHNQPFRDKIEECDALFREFGNWSLMKELSRDQSSSRMEETEIAQPAIFALQVALVALWRSYGVVPSAVVGHSMGEVAAAHVAGVLTLRAAARIIFHRGRAMSFAPSTGRMLAASVNETQARELAASYRGQVVVAGYNSPNSVTFSGEQAPLDRIAQTLEARGIFNRFLQVSFAFHSHQMDPVKSGLLRSLGKVETSPAQLPLWSTVTGKLTDGLNMTTDYWWRNVRKPVRFSDAIAGLIAEGHSCFIELGAHPALTAALSETLAQTAASGTVLFSLRRNEPELTTIFENLAALHLAGSPISWKSIFAAAGNDISLPLFPWQRERHWNEPFSSRAIRLNAPAHPFLTVKLDAPTPAWNTWLDLNAKPWLKDHCIENHIVFPGAGYVEAALGIGAGLYPSRQLEIEDIEFLRALHLPEGKDPIQLQSVYDPRDSSVTFSTHESSPGADWNRNAGAKLRARVQTDPPLLDLKRIQAGLPELLSADDVYASSARRGLFYGPMFQAIESVWRRDGEALGKIRLPKMLAASADEFRFHPSLLDGCFQLAMISAPASHDRITFVPVRIDRIAYLAPPGPVVFCHSRLVHASLFSPVLDLRITDPSGRVLMEVDGYHAQAVRGHTAPAHDAPENWLYETRWIEKPIQKPASGQPLPGAMPGTWLILADRSGVATKLAALLKRRGASPVLLFRDDLVKDQNGQTHASLPSHLQKLMAGPDRTSLAGILHLWSLDIRDHPHLNAAALLDSQAAGTHSALHLVHAMESCTAAPPLWLITRGAQSVLPSKFDKVSVAQSPLLGLGRTINSEYPRISCRLVDLDSAKPEFAARNLLRELEANDGETEVAWRAGARFAGRITPTRLELHAPKAPPSANSGYRLSLPLSGVMDDLALNEISRRKPGPGEVEIEIHAAALNFRDVMKLLGIYPIESDRDILIGDECSGRIVSVGKDVRDFRIGDQVIACGAGCFASHLTIPAGFVLPKPARLTHQQAATIPVAFMTAWYALHNLGKIQRGERILIHAATGGVGLAAIQIAQLAGAEIFATAGNEEKRAFLRSLGIRHVMDSRTTAFAEEIRRLTQVDIVLNSLAGEAIGKGLSLLAPGGRFLEIGKRDIYANTPIGLRPLRNNISMFVIDMGQVMAGQPQTVQALLLAVLKLFRKGRLHPLPHQSLPISRAAAAFRLMAQAKHIGKIVLATQDAHATPLRMPPARPIAFSAKASWLITGGLGGFGLAIAKWLIANGARHLVLCGISGAVSAEAKRDIARLRRLGAQILIVKADVSSPNEVARMLATIKLRMPPLRGVFHAAMVLDDGLLTDLTEERFTRVFAPKALGAWNLHAALAKVPAKIQLDHFVLFSSISALIGSPGQANYAAANSFLDALAHHRRARGLPALAVNWGALGQVGVVARNPALAAQLKAGGLYPFSPDQATGMLGRLLQRNVTQIGFMHVDWQKMFSKKAGAPLPPRFSDVVVATLLDPSAASEDLRSILLSASTEERQALVVNLVRECVAKVLRTAPSRLDTSRPLREMGLDSLMAFELLNRLQTKIGASLPNSKMSANSSIESLTVVVLDAFKDAPSASIGGKPSAVTSSRSATSHPIAPDQQMIPYRAHGSLPAVFFIHPAGGRTSIYDDLAAQLSRQLPVYAIQSRLLSGAQEEWNSLEEMAQDYAGLIVEQQPEGPIRLAGFSAGGIFALAAASELERSGRKVSLLSMIETPLAMLDPTRNRVSILKSLITEVYDRLVANLPRSRRPQLPDISAHIMRLAQRLVRTRSESARVQIVLDWLTQRGLLASRDADSDTRRFFAAFVRHSILIEQATLQPVLARVYLCRAKESGLSASLVAPRAFAHITHGGLQQEVFKGRHFELMRPPLVKALAHSLEAALAGSLV